MTDIPELQRYTIKEAAAKLDLSLARMGEMVRAGRFPNASKNASGLWMIPGIDLRNELRRRRNGGSDRR